MADKDSDLPAQDPKQRNDAIASLDDEQRKRFQHRVFLQTEATGEEPGLRLQQHLATIIARDLPPGYESRDIEQAVRDDAMNLQQGQTTEHEPAPSTEQPKDDRSSIAQSAGDNATPAPLKHDDLTEGVHVGRAPRDYSELQATHDDVASASKQPDSPAELRPRIDLLQREAEHMSGDVGVLRGARQLFEIKQRRLDRQISAGEPEAAAALRAEKEACAHEYVGYLTDTIGNHLERDGRHDEATNMHRDAEARREIAAQLRSAEPTAPSSAGMIDDPGHRSPNFGQERLSGVDAVARGPGHYADLKATHANVAAAYDPGDDVSAERVLARTNSEIAGRQQVEVAMLAGAISPDTALTRDDIRAEIKSMVANAAKRADGPKRDAGQHANEMPGRPSPSRGGFGP